MLAEFLAEQLFGRWSLVLHYDLGRGLRAFAGRDEARLKEMVALANRRVGDLSALSREPAATFAILDRFVRANIMAKEEDRLSVAVILDQASYLFPAGEPGRASLQTSSQVVTMLNWAMSPHVKRLNMAFVLIDERLSDVSDRLTGNPHVASIEVPLPDEEERRLFVESSGGAGACGGFGLQRRGAGQVDRRHLDHRSQRADPVGARDRPAPRHEVFRALKKRLLERQCRGLLEFIEPKWTLDTVVGHDAAKARLREDAALLKRGALDTLPMGYLLCGPVGTGKSFLAQCVSGEIGVPCLMLKNFRSKYVGETEGNLERVLAVLRAMGPVVVVVDEADAALGSREQDGDSGTSSRVFGMIAAQMGDTQYRGRIFWMLLTARPDLLPIDLKRQGRAEVHIPLFYPTDEAEIRQMFVIMAKKLGTTLDARGRPVDSAEGASLGRGHRRHGRPRLAPLAPRRPEPNHQGGARAGGVAVHAVHAGARTRAAGDRGDARVHRSPVPAGRHRREDGSRRRPRQTAGAAHGDQATSRGHVISGAGHMAQASGYRLRAPDYRPPARTARSLKPEA